MPRGDRDDAIVGVNWGSSNFRAYLIDADGSAADEYAAPCGIIGIERDGMAAVMDQLVERWPGERPIYVSGMIGSNVGWCEVPYAHAPAGPTELLAASVETGIGAATVRIIPGVTCRRSFDDAPDILRGEEIELLGVASFDGGSRIVALPGTHTKWARLDGSRVGEFMTSMSGEIFDRLTAQGLLASIVEGGSREGPAFDQGTEAALEGQLGLGSLLFGARARVIRGDLPRSEAASYIRGLLVGADVADALLVSPSLNEGRVALIGNAELSRLYARALRRKGIETDIVDARDACLKGFRTLHEALCG